MARNTRTESIAKARAARGKKDINPADIITSLEIDETYTFAKVLRFDDMLDPSEEIPEAMNSLRSQCSVYISRAKDPDGLDDRTFSTRSGKFISDDCREVACLVTVKRDA
jgi:hypothetical protein